MVVVSPIPEHTSYVAGSARVNGREIERDLGVPFDRIYAPTVTQTNTTVKTSETGQKLIYITGAATLAQVVRALNTIGVSPRDLISIVQALRESGSLQADIDII